MSKQDRTYARTAVDLERKYNFGKTFAEVLGIATDAQEAAKEVKETIENLDQDEIFKLLTNNGKSQGVYRDENGDIYINASYIVSGILKSADGNTYFDLDKGEIVAINKYVDDTETSLHSTGFYQKWGGNKLIVIAGDIGFSFDGTEVFGLEPAENGPILSLPPYEDTEATIMTSHQLHWKNIAGVPMITDPDAEFSFADLGVTATIAEINYLAGVKSSLQAQLDALESRIKALEG